MMQLTAKYTQWVYGDTKLTTNNIVKVKVYTKNNIPYRWNVYLKGRCWREFGNFNEKGACSSDPFPFEALPVSVKRYILKRTPVLNLNHEALVNSIHMTRPNTTRVYDYI